MSRIRSQAGRSNLEETLALQLKAAHIAFRREYRFDEERRFRFDFVVWNDEYDFNEGSSRVAVECEGSVWTGGRHTRGAGFQSDCEKYNLAVERGWRVLRYTMKQIQSGDALAQIERVLA